MRARPAAPGIVRLPASCLVVLVGPAAAGKSTWAAEQFRPSQVVSSDRIRGLVGEGSDDQRASKDAFEVLDLVLERRLARRLLTVVDSLAIDPARREHYREAARRHGMPCYAVMFGTPAAVCRARNKARGRSVPARVVTGQLAQFGDAQATIAGEGFDGVLAPASVHVVPPALARAPGAIATFGEVIAAFAGHDG